jgi:protease-4
MAEMEPGSWERQTLEKVALAAIHEQRRGRNWGIFFKLLLFIHLFALLFVGMGWFGKKESSPSKHTALIEVNGVISPTSQASAESIMSGLQEAYKDKRTQGVVLRINSPGGSPVQAGHINDEIRRRSMRWSRTSARRGVITSRLPPTRSTSTRRASSARSA